ncbi:thiamine-phosphate kinase [Candidatus Calescamantes bacterium]|nr:thiamine-phosphate kinase [Candidatus Calescamantes bacterium]
MREEEIIEFLRNFLAGRNEGVLVGIGDDAAVVKLGGERIVLTCDTLEEGVHFLRDYFPLYFLGWKGMAVSISDIYAMGGEPLYSLVSLGVVEESGVEEIFRGVKEFSSQFKVEVVGGNLVRSDRWWIEVFSLGRVENPILRSGAKIGDLIVITGYPGEASAGRKVLEEGRNGYSELKERFLKPYPRKEILEIKEEFSLTSLIDISDGVGRDLYRILKESEKGAEIFPDYLPISRSLKDFAGEKAFHYFWSGGEDYELIFTVEKGVNLPSCWKELPLTIIGEITGDVGVIKSGEQILEPAGYEHFK